MRKSELTADTSAESNANAAQYSNYSPAMMDTLAGLELICRSKSPAREIRDAMTDKPQQKPFDKLAKNAKARMKAFRQRKIRESLVTLLVAVDERDEIFFGDMARLFGSKLQTDSNPPAADSLRLELSVQRHLQEHFALDGKTFGQLQAQTGVDRRTLARAVRESGLKTNPDRKGRPPRNAGE